MMTFMLRTLCLVASLTGLVSAATAPENRLFRCEKAEFERLSQHKEGGQVTFRYRNKSGFNVAVYWVDGSGREVHRGSLEPHNTEWNNMGSFPGHAFRFKLDGTDHPLLAYIADGDGEDVTIEACSDTKEQAEKAAKEAVLDDDRWPEFEELTKGGTGPCEGPSENWSCVRHVTQEEVDARVPTEYGFLPHDVPSNRKIGQDIDPGYGANTQAFMINVTEFDAGYLKMKMSKRLKRILFPWYTERLKDSVKTHEPIAGGYTNVDTISMSKIDLDFFPEQHSAIINEMKQILEWWTRMRLKHTATFGARIYHRGAMLIDHVDRQDTHVASAVLQVSQSGMDKDGGWPLEIIHPHHGGRIEVYMQPGEMVLYEGARIHHGRPMRLKGDAFGNIFSHFAPITWGGPTNERNPFFDINKRKAAHSEL